MIKRPEDFSAKIQRIFSERVANGNFKELLTLTFQVTTDCSLRCSYCYQINKSHEMMSWDIAKKTIDFILAEAKKEDSLFSYNKYIGIIFDFIGGEPLLNIDLITQIIDYFEKRLIEEDSPWLLFHRYSFSSNGVHYFEPKVQNLLKKYSDLISMGITVDGYKELHDKCRLFPNGEGSYEYAIAAALDQKNYYHNNLTKITLCPDNIQYTAKAIINMLELGFDYVHANCVFEEGWELSHAKILYEQMKIISDYILKNNLEDKCGVSLFNEVYFDRLPDDDTNNWCGGTGSMLAVDYKGDFYPCVRYMESSLGNDQKPLIIGNINKKGPYGTQEEKNIFIEMRKITRQSQSPEECLQCPISNGCAWCSAYNYQKFGTANKRATFICIMHKARAIGNYYYFIREAKKKKIDCKFKLNLPKEEVINIIGEKEYLNLNKP